MNQKIGKRSDFLTFYLLLVFFLNIIKVNLQIYRYYDLKWNCYNNIGQLPFSN